MPSPERFGVGNSVELGTNREEKREKEGLGTKTKKGKERWWRFPTGQTNHASSSCSFCYSWTLVIMCKVETSFEHGGKGKERRRKVIVGCKNHRQRIPESQILTPNVVTEVVVLTSEALIYPRGISPLV